MVGFYVRGKRRAAYGNVRRDSWLVYGTECVVPRFVSRAFRQERGFREVVAYGREGSKLVVHFA